MSNDAPVRVVTFGCRMNAYESELMRAHAEEAGLSDAIIVNTCAVTAEAERQTRQTIRKLHRENPEAKIIVTGCAAQLAPAAYAEMEGVARVLGNREKLTAAAYAEDGGDAVRVTDIMTARETSAHLLEGFEGRSRAFVQVQQGCDHRCTFCIIPFARGPNRSQTPARIVREIRTVLEGGTPEIVLTGVDVTAYGTDAPGLPPLGGLVRHLLDEIPEMTRLRLTSLDPVEIDDELFRLLVTEPRLMPHVHLSVQAGDDMILKRMKRRHNRADVVGLARALRAERPDIALGADIIAGFPTETEEMFANGLALIDEAEITHLHVFPFSPRPGTPAARMPQVKGDVVKERARALREAGARRMAALLSTWVGRTATMVLENRGQGRTDHYLPVQIDENALTRAPAVGTVAAVAISGHDGTTLHGTPA
ncbi:MAG: tRNA (N(6)-L-threonylcarbamoyladenosine(37)-C(2))-methylthiotransferase MtaB [Rhodospirillaceae bacterium]